MFYDLVRTGVKQPASPQVVSFSNRHLRVQYHVVNGSRTTGASDTVTTFLNPDRPRSPLLHHRPSRCSIHAGWISLNDDSKYQVSRMGQKEQQAVAHLKGRLVKERGIVDARRKTVSCFICDPPRRHSVRRYIVIVAYSLVLSHTHGPVSFQGCDPPPPGSSATGMHG